MNKQFWSRFFVVVGVVLLVLALSFIGMAVTSKKITEEEILLAWQIAFGLALAGAGCFLVRWWLAETDSQDLRRRSAEDIFKLLIRLMDSSGRYCLENFAQAPKSNKNIAPFWKVAAVSAFALSELEALGDPTSLAVARAVVLRAFQHAQGLAKQEGNSVEFLAFAQPTVEFLNGQRTLGQTPPGFYLHLMELVSLKEVKISPVEKEPDAS